MESIERENQQLKGESQQSRTENPKTWNELEGACRNVQGAYEEQGRRLHRVEYSLNLAELPHQTHAERLATVENQRWDEAKRHHNELQRRQEANAQTKEWINLIETKGDRVLERQASVPTDQAKVPDGALSNELNEAFLDAKRHGDQAREAAIQAMDAMQEVKILVHNVQSKSRDMGSWSAAIKHTANVVKGQKEAIHDTINDVETKIKMAIGSMEAQAERLRTNVDSAKPEFVQLDQEREAEMDQAMKLLKQQAAALDAKVERFTLTWKPQLVTCAMSELTLPTNWRPSTSQKMTWLPRLRK